MRLESIGSIMDTANRINDLCDAAGLDYYSGFRVRLHRLHGELIAHDADSQEVARVIESELSRELQARVAAQVVGG